MRLPDLEKIAGEAVAQAQRTLPPLLALRATEVPVHCAALPGEEAPPEEAADDLLGLFVGSSLSDGDREDVFPPQIFLYLENIWSYVEGNTKEFRAEVKLTYLHELGHYLGWDEEDLTARGLD